MPTIFEIEKLIRQSDYDEALDACSKMLDGDPGAMNEVCRLKSWIFTSQGKYQMGVEEMTIVIESGKASIADFHSAAFWSLYDEQFVVAKEWFERVLDLGKTQSDSWFESSSLFYLSYIFMKLGNYVLAYDFLEQSGSLGDVTGVLIPNIGSYTRDELHKEINRRMIGQ